jgi:hypothetical protein
MKSGFTITNSNPIVKKNKEIIKLECDPNPMELLDHHPHTHIPLLPPTRTPPPHTQNVMSFEIAFLSFLDMIS